MPGLLAELLAQPLHLAAQALVLAAQCLTIRRWTSFGARSSMRGSQRLLNIQNAKCSAPCQRFLGPTHLNCYRFSNHDIRLLLHRLQEPVGTLVERCTMSTRYLD